MMQTIPIREVGDLLRYKDVRSIKRWCANNSVKILTDNGSRKMYVIKEEFELARMQKAVEYLSQKESELKNKIQYNPQGEHEKKFLSRLTKMISGI